MVRDKEETKERILAAVGKLLAESGFQKIGVNAIAREAGIDKVLIYRYFDSLPSLLRIFAYESNYWPSLDELIANQASAEGKETLADWMVKLLIALIDELQQRPITQEIMRWELLERNELTAELSRVRDETAIAALNLLQQKQASPPEADVPAVGAILVAGIIYLLLRSKATNTFFGIDLQSPEGWQRIEQAITLIVQKTIANADAKIE